MELIACLIAIVASVSATAGALIGAHMERVYTGALVGLLLGPAGVLFTLCAAAARTLNPRLSRSAENACFVLGPLGLIAAWWNAPAAPRT